VHREQAVASQHPVRNNFKSIAKKVLGKYAYNYSDYYLWEVLLQKYLPFNQGFKVLEVGSAPGTNLVKLHNLLGYIPYGVDYSEEGVALNKTIFAGHNLNPNNVILADFFSETFQSQYKEYFDVVFSMGFLEHFTDVEQVVTNHVTLLKKGGLIVVTIPNLRGFNAFLSNVFCKQVLNMCNLSIMDKGNFSALFARDDIEPVFCDYYGTFSFDLFFTKNRFLKILYKICKLIQIFLNVVFYTIGSEGVQSRFFSPYLIYIGKKR
jgi:2-polyprenyl-3-methyl-5-hydroxy-6-metoxy-1,4-benzoquinol methylase